MNHKEYLKLREELGVPNLKIIDEGDLNLYNKYPMLPVTSEGHINGEVYRCHLAEDFLQVTELDHLNKQELLISHGVRNTLETLFTLHNSKKWLIPEDCYPWYNQKAREYNLNTSTYQVLKTSGNIFQDLLTTDADILLTTEPLKPTGRDLNEEEWDTLNTWVKDENKLLIIDTVYSLNLSTMTKLWNLYHNNRNVIIAHSLSKSYATPKSIGITITKQAELTPIFRNIPKDEGRLRQAYTLLNHGAEHQKLIKDSLRQASQELQLQTSMKLSEHTYMYYDPYDDHEMLLRQGILAVPTSVYGSTQPGVIRTNLPNQYVLKH